MTDDRPSVKDIFGEAIEKPPEMRAAYLDGACRGDPDLREQVETLLEAWEQAGDFLAAPTTEHPAHAVEVAEQPGEKIGVYKLLQSIGEGGMGSVYMAEQTEPVRRRVALKIIKLGMDTKQVIGRFEAERQALAMMDHPNIAKVLDAGSTETGRPYFVMELVKGVSVTEYCDGNHLSTPERLTLFVRVCNAVQHAHQKGIIHRDLKPSNVLITLHDGVPVPKVIDFGIAKATSQRLTDKTIFTEFRSFIGTPEYMSPEQAEMSGLDIDTRSDIYSLGVLLYELLTGTTPFDAKELRKAAFDEMQRIIREREPPKPSTRLSTMGEGLTAAAAHRKVDPSALPRSLRGDLDWIVMKALEKDRTRRYSSATELAADIERHLGDEPVLAGPPSLIYKTGKFIRRNKAAVVSIAAIVILLLGGIVGTTWGLVVAQRQTQQAVDARASAEQQASAARRARDAEERQRNQAEASRAAALESQRAAQYQAERARVVTDFLADTLAFADPEVALTPDITVVSVLEHAGKHLSTRFADQPEVESKLRSTIGRALMSLGEEDQAERQLRRALEIQDQLDDVDAWDQYKTMWPLTGLVFMRGSSEVMTMGGRVVRLGLQMVSEQNPELADHLGDMVDGNMSGRLDKGQRGFEGMKAVADRDLAPGDPLWQIVADDLYASGYAIWLFHGNPVAATYLHEALDIYRRELPETHPQIAQTIDLLVELLAGTGEYESAEALVRESIALRANAVGADHWYLAIPKALLGQCLVGQGRFGEAEDVLLASLEIGEEIDYVSPTALGALVELYTQWDRPEDAEVRRAQLAQQLVSHRQITTLAIARPAFGPEHAELLEPLDEVQGFGMRIQLAGDEEEQSRRFAELQRELDDFFPRCRELIDADDPLAGLIARLLLSWAELWEPPGAFNSLQTRVFDEAVSVLRSWEDVVPAELGMGLWNLGRFEAREGATERAELHLREALQLVEKSFGESSWQRAIVMLALAQLLEGLGRHAESEPLLVAAYPVFAEQVGEMSWDTFRCAREISSHFERIGRPEEARPFTAIQVAAQRRVAQHPPPEWRRAAARASFLVSCVPADLRDPATALQLAIIASEDAGWTQADPLTTIARAAVQLGDPTRAIAVVPQDRPASRDFVEQELQKLTSTDG